MDKFFIIFVFFPSIAITYAVLAMLYDTARAYIALSWIPITIFLFIKLVDHLESGLPIQDQLSDSLIEGVIWISFLQFLLGIGLTIYSIWKKDIAYPVLLATCLVVIPFIWGMFT